MIVKVSDLGPFIRRTLEGIRDGIKASREAGVQCDEPDGVDFEIQLVDDGGVNAITRTSTTTPGTETVTATHLEDQVTTHGRTQREERVNNGDTVTTSNTVQEQSGG